MQRNAFAHLIISVENAAILVILNKTKRNEERTQNRNPGISRGGSRGKPKHGRRGGNPQSQRNVRQVTEETMDLNHANSDDFYEFSARNSEGKNTKEMLIENKPVNVIID